MQAIKPKRNPEKIYLRVVGGKLQPADAYAEIRMKDLGYKDGDVVKAQLSKLRKIGTNKNAHKIALLLMENSDEFSRYSDPHAVLKRIQIESGAACEEIMIKQSGMSIIYRYPLSFSFDSLGEEYFIQAIKTMCAHIAENYWNGMTGDQINEMSERMPV